MDARLIGKKIFVGREPGNARLKLLMQVGDEMKETTIGDNNSVDSTVSRCLSAERAHCCIEVCQDRRLRLTNMNENNITSLQERYIDSVTFELQPNTEVILGSEKYVLDLNAVLRAVSYLFPQVFDIKPLEAVWSEYENSVRSIKVRREKFVAISSVTGILSTLGMVCLFIPGLGSFRILFVLLSLALAVIFFVYKFKAPEKNIKEDEDVKNKLISDYVCPNPNCRQFLGTIPYRILSQNHACPYCKGKWEKQ